MKLIARQQGSRRMDLPVEFPLTDGDDVLVLSDRRLLPDRRKPMHDINDLKVILAKICGD